MQALLGFAIFVGAWVAVSRHFGKKGAGAFRRHLAGFGVGFLSLCVFIGVVGDRAATSAPQVAQGITPAPVAEKAELLAVTAKKLYEAYDANEVAADRKYKGRLLAVGGSVQSVDKDAFDHIIIHLKTPNEVMSVYAYLDSKSEAIAASMSKGQSVSFVCKGDGRLVGSPVLRDCQPS